MIKTDVCILPLSVLESGEDLVKDLISIQETESSDVIDYLSQRIRQQLSQSTEREINNLARGLMGSFVNEKTIDNATYWIINVKEKLNLSFKEEEVDKNTNTIFFKSLDNSLDRHRMEVINGKYVMFVEDEFIRGLVSLRYGKMAGNKLTEHERSQLSILINKGFLNLLSLVFDNIENDFFDKDVVTVNEWSINTSVLKDMNSQSKTLFEEFI